MKIVLLISWTVASLILTAGCGESGPAMSVSGVQVIAPAPGRKASVAYFTIHNRGSNAVLLNGVTSPQFGRVEMHETVLEMGIARMRALTSLKVDARSSVELAAGGKHLMLSEPVKVLLPDSPVSLHLQFASEVTLIVQTSIRTRHSID